MDSDRICFDTSDTSAPKDIEVACKLWGFPIEFDDPEMERKFIRLHPHRQTIPDLNASIPGLALAATKAIRDLSLKFLITKRLVIKDRKVRAYSDELYFGYSEEFVF